MVPLLNDKEVILGIAEDLKEIKEKVSKIEINLGILNVKAGLWGLIGGILPVAGLVVMYILFKN